MKLYAILAAVALLAGAVLYVNRLQAKAARVDLAESKQKAAEQRELDTAQRFLKAAERDEATQAELSGIRAEMAASALSFARALKAKPLVNEVKHVENGQTVTCTERDAARYLELFNGALNTAPDTASLF